MTAQASNASIIEAFLEQSLGLTKAQADGGLGNIEEESNFNPASGNAQEGAIGSDHRIKPLSPTAAVQRQAQILT